GTEGGVTLHLPDGEQMSIYDAAMRYQADGVPLVVLAGKEDGSGSSRDWAAKGPMLLGVRAVLAESYERIHRANLVGMGILPLELPAGETVEALGRTGHETFEITGLQGAGADGFPREVAVRADDQELTCRVRIDTPNEFEYYRHGGILQYVLRQLRGERRPRARRWQGWRTGPGTGPGRPRGHRSRWPGGRCRGRRRPGRRGRRGC